MDHVIHKIPEFSTLTSQDQVCDIGCGDGRCILQWAKAYSSMQQQQEQAQESLSRDATNNTESTAVSFPSFVGIDIDAARIEQAQSALQQARQQGEIHAQLPVSFYCANALDSPELFQNATILFLYLIPRGLRIIKPLLLQVSSERSKLPLPTESAQENPLNLQQQQWKRDKQGLYVVTYMAPLPDEVPIRVDKISVPHQPMTAWPIYLYQLGAKK